MPVPSLIPYLVRWEEAIGEGHELSPEELADGRPELVAALRQGIAALKQMRGASEQPTMPPGAGLFAVTPALPSGGEATGDAPPGYEILGELGRGGMGVVYRARQVALGREVALKMILTGGHAGAEDRARFLAEAESIAKVRHPGIVQVFDFGTHAGLPWFSLELCEGGSLADRLRDGPLPPKDAAAMVEKVARAMQAAHEAGVVHRDLKPGNVLLVGQASRPDGADRQAWTPDLQPKVTDFGLAKKLGDSSGHTATGAVMGTPSYMAPEQAEGKKDVGPPADVYALGAILYACLTGRPPFQAATPLDTILQVVSDDPVSVRQLNNKVPADLETICLKCLQKSPLRRYASAAALADDLGRWQAGRPIEARPVGRMERLWSWCRREPVTASLVSAVTLALLVGTAVAWWLAAWALGEKGRADTEAGLKEQEAVAARKAEDKAKENEARAKEREEAATFQAYRAEDAKHAIQIGLAMSAWERHDIAEAERILGEMDARFKDAWETRHVRGLCRRKARPLLKPDDRIRRVAYSPDGKRIATGDEEGTLTVLDAETGKVMHTIKGASPPLAFSPDSKRIIGGNWGNRPPGGGETKAWDVETGKEFLHLEDAGDAVCFSPDGNRIVASSSTDFEVKVWDAETGKVLATFEDHREGVRAVAISPDGRRVASADADRKVKVWDARTGKALLPLKGNPGNVTGLAFSPDGSRILCVGGDQISTWHTETGLKHLSWPGEKGVMGAAFSPDGKLIVCGGFKAVRVWDAETGKEGKALRGRAGWVTNVAFSRDGTRLASMGTEGTLEIWEMDAPVERLSRKRHTGMVNGLAFSPDGRTLASAGSGSLFRIVYGEVKLWDPETGVLKHTLKNHERVAHAVAFSPDGKRIVTGGGDHMAKVCDAETGKVMFPCGPSPTGVIGVAFSRDGKLIASVGHHEGVVSDARTGERIAPFGRDNGEISSLAFSHDSARIATAATDGRVRLWDPRTGQLLATLETGCRDARAVAFSPDGKLLACAVGIEVRVWDAVTRREKPPLKSHTEEVLALAFSADGTRIVSAGHDKTVRLYDPRTGQEKLSLKGHTEAIRSVAFSSDGRRIASGDDGGNVKVWDAPSAK